MVDYTAAATDAYEKKKRTARRQNAWLTNLPNPSGQVMTAPPDSRSETLGTMLSRFLETVGMPPRLAADYGGYARNISDMSLPGTLDQLDRGDIGGVAEGMIIGPGARMWRKAEAELADKLLMKGAPRQEVLDQTGTFELAGGQLAQEIPDVGSKMIAPVSSRSQVLPDVFEHPEFYEAYPEFRKVKTTALLPNSPGHGGSYVRGNIFYPPEIQINRSMSPDLQRKSMLHEVTHGVQDIEHWPIGDTPNKIMPGSPSQKLYDDEIRALTERYGPLNNTTKYVAERNAAEEGYRRNSAEAEARNVARRREGTAKDLRAKPWWETLDVPLEEQLVRDPYGETLAQLLKRGMKW